MSDYKVIKSKEDIEKLEFGNPYIIDVGIDYSKPDEISEKGLAEEAEIQSLIEEKFKEDSVQYECRVVEKK